ncbi:MAG: hypothetical protein QNK11_07865, partial [Legionella sp.]|nr:hypothetical protein [Legionella sp.]
MLFKQLLILPTLMLLPILSFSKPTPAPITTDMLFEQLQPGEPFDKSILTFVKAVTFSQATASPATDATEIAQTRLAFFTSSDCSSSDLNYADAYTTSGVKTFTLPALGTAFGLTARAVWNVGDNLLSIADMTAINSIAVTLFSDTTSEVPQSSFSGTSFLCMTAVTCTAGPSGSCTSGLENQSFTLKAPGEAAVGDPASGGIIGCIGDQGDPTLNKMIVTSLRHPSTLPWSPSTTISTGISDSFDGAVNTPRIVRCLTDG